MPHLSAAAARLALRALAIVLPFLAAVPLASVALPARAAVSPFPPIDLGTHPVGSSTSYDLVVPLTIPFASIPASYDGVVLFTAPDPATVTALALAGFASPVTVGQVKALMPVAAITFAAPTANFSNPSGGYLFTDLGCDASSCSYRFGFVPPGPGTFDAHVEIGVAGVAIVNGGLLGSLLTLLYPLAADMINAYLVYDVTGKAVVVARAQPVPGPDAWMLAVLGALLAAAGVLALTRTKDQRRQDSGR